MAGRERASSDGVTPKGLSSVGNGLGPDRVIEIQRARMLAAVVAVSAERGAANVSVAHVVERAGVSRRTFYEVFADREECFLAAFDEGIARASRSVLEAYDPNARWAVRVRGALVALLLFLDAEPDVARLLAVESLGAGADVLERRRGVLARVAAVVDEGRREARARAEPPVLTAEGIVGGALSIVHARLLDSRDGELTGLAGPLMSMIVLPYLGAAAARRELERPPPSPTREGSRETPRDPLKELGMRLTYRTVRVLLAVGARSGSSNRDVGLAAGIGDQGQISKLLARLERLELVSNTGLGQSRGAPNAWVLTERGEEVCGAFTAG
jgi:AcrR family transcriptional regulator